MLLLSFPRALKVLFHVSYFLRFVWFYVFVFFLQFSLSKFFLTLALPFLLF